VENTWEVDMLEVDMKESIAFLAGAAFGAGLMYALDPEAGRRRQAQARDRLRGTGTRVREAASARAQDLKNRTYGIAAEARSRWFGSNVSDDVLTDRVQSKLGYVVRNPSAVLVRVEDGRVVLSGPVRADELSQLLAEVGAVRGVRGVENRLDVHDEPGNVPELQGDKPKPSPRRLDVLQRRWSPATRVLLAASGAAIVYAATRPQFARPALSSLGLEHYVSGRRSGDRQSLRRQPERKPFHALYDRLSSAWCA
jgi:hypothetical protein